MTVTEKVAVITVAHGRHDHLRSQHAALGRSQVEPDLYIVVAIDDPWIVGWVPPGVPHPQIVSFRGRADSLPLAAARNAGARAAIEAGATILVFLDVDCLAHPALVGAYRAYAIGENLCCGPVGYLPPQTNTDRLEELEAVAPPHPARPAPAPGEVLSDPAGHALFWSLSFALDVALWKRIGGFDEGYVGYGAEDTDFGRRAAALGIPLLWLGSARAFHQYHPISDPPIEHVEAIVRNGARFAQKWGEWPMQDWLEGFVSRGLVVREGEGYTLA